MQAIAQVIMHAMSQVITQVIEQVITRVITRVLAQSTGDYAEMVVQGVGGARGGGATRLHPAVLAKDPSYREEDRAADAERHEQLELEQLAEQEPSARRRGREPKEESRLEKGWGGSGVGVGWGGVGWGGGGVRWGIHGC